MCRKYKYIRLKTGLTYTSRAKHCHCLIFHITILCNKTKPVKIENNVLFYQISRTLNLN